MCAAARGSSHGSANLPSVLSELLGRAEFPGGVRVHEIASDFVPGGMLHELGVEQDHEAVAGGVTAIINASRLDGRIRVAPKAPLYPCYTAEATG